MARANPIFPRPRLQGGGDGAESHDLLAAGYGRRCQLAAGRGGGRDEGTEEVAFWIPRRDLKSRRMMTSGIRLSAAVCAGLQERGGGERHRAGPTEGHSLGAGGDRSRGVPLLLGYYLSQRLGE